MPGGPASRKWTFTCAAFPQVASSARTPAPNVPGAENENAPGENPAATGPRPTTPSARAARATGSGRARRDSGEKKCDRHGQDPSGPAPAGFAFGFLGLDCLAIGGVSFAGATARAITNSPRDLRGARS